MIQHFISNSRLCFGSHLQTMVASGPQQAKRALVKVLLALAAIYTVRLQVSRDSGDTQVLKAYKRVALKVHPDKGGLLEHCQSLNTAKDAWDKARQKGPKAGRPKQQDKKTNPEDSSSRAVAETAEAQEGSQRKKGYRVQSFGVLLTCNGVEDQAQMKPLGFYKTQ
jgi:hypothetical protein